MQERRLLGAVTAGGAGRVADQHVDRPGLQGRESFGCLERLDVDLGGVTEHGSGHGATEVDVEAGEVAFGIDAAEAGEAVVATAVEHVAGLHGGEHAAALRDLDGVVGCGGVAGSGGVTGCGGVVGRVVVAAACSRHEGEYGDGTGSSLPALGGALTGHSSS